MIQDIFPSKLKNEFVNIDISESDNLFIFNGEGKVLLGNREGTAVFPTEREVKCDSATYLFSVDEEKYFLAFGNTRFQKDGFDYYSIREARDRFSGKEVYAIFTAYHLWKWYSDNLFCGKCAEKLMPDQKERALRCSKCGT